QGLILFTGSSSIRTWTSLEKDMAGYTVLNRGFGGSQISDVLHYFDRIVTPYKPSKIAFYCGENDLHKGKSVETVVNDFKTFARRVHEMNPETPIYFISVKPSPKRWASNPQYVEANRHIRSFCETDARLVYLDMASAMLGEDGKPLPDIWKDDQLHLNAKGYEIWTPILRKAFEASDPYRLSKDAVPVFQSVSLNLNPDEDEYDGHVSIDIEAKKAVSKIRFHAEEMDWLEVEILHGKQFRKVPHREEPPGFITVTPKFGLRAGRHTMKVRFKKRYNRKGAGIYKTVSDGQGYLFTQMEPESGRLAFPCFDEPEFKIPWELRIEFPAHYQAYANTPVEREHRVETETKNHRSILFSRTPPMPSYLLALAVGPFETRAVHGLSVPSRIICPKHQLALTEMSDGMTKPLLDYLETYFESPYPYRKLDQIAVPEFNAGAMENVGLITYRDTILLLDNQLANQSQKERMAIIIAHELAHMWFGNLVT
ncbi:MAG: M1 family aminopeptidase, partial [Verrucomicrobiota bacterium]